MKLTRTKLKEIIREELLNERVSDNDVLLDKSSKSWAIEQSDITKALKKDRKIAKHIGQGIYFDGLDLVANDSSETIVTLKWNWKLKDLKKAILKKNPKKWKN